MWNKLLECVDVSSTKIVSFNGINIRTYFSLFPLLEPINFNVFKELFYCLQLPSYICNKFKVDGICKKVLFPNYPILVVIYEHFKFEYHFVSVGFRYCVEWYVKLTLDFLFTRKRTNILHKRVKDVKLFTFSRKKLFLNF